MPHSNDDRKSAEQAALDALLAPYLATADDFGGSVWTRRPLLRDVITGQQGRDGTPGEMGVLPVLKDARTNGPLCRKLREAAGLTEALLSDVLACPVSVVRSWEEGGRTLVPELVPDDHARGVERLYGCIGLWLGPDEFERLKGEGAEATAA